MRRLLEAAFRLLILRWMSQVMAKVNPKQALPKSQEVEVILDKKSLEPKDILNVVFKLTDYLNLQWNFYVVFNVAVIGWLFSNSNNPWVGPKKLISFMLYFLFVTMSLLILLRTYGLLFSALEELSYSAQDINFRSAKFAKLFKEAKPFSRGAAITFHVIAALMVLIAILAKGRYF